MNYTELVAEVCAWVNKPEAEPAIATLVGLAEAGMNRILAEAGITGAEGRSTATVDTEYGVVPTDYAAPIEMTVSDGTTSTRLANITQAGFDMLKAENPTEEGRPRAFTTIGGEFRYLPAPDASYTVTLRYQKKLAALSDACASNWLIAGHPDAYLFGVLCQAGAYVDDKRLSTWGAMFAAAMGGVVAAERRKQGSQKTPGYRASIPGQGSAFNINTDR